MAVDPALWRRIAEPQKLGAQIAKLSLQLELA